MSLESHNLFIGLLNIVPILLFLIFGDINGVQYTFMETFSLFIGDIHIQFQLLVIEDELFGVFTGVEIPVGKRADFGV